MGLLGDDWVELAKLGIFLEVTILGFLTICFCTVVQKQHKIAAEVWKSPEFQQFIKTQGRYFLCLVTAILWDIWSKRVDTKFLEENF